MADLLYTWLADALCERVYDCPSNFWPSFFVINWEGTRLVARESQDLNRRIREAISIKRTPHNMNRDSGTPTVWHIRCRYHPGFMPGWSLIGAKTSVASQHSFEKDDSPSSKLSQVINCLDVHRELNKYSSCYILLDPFQLWAFNWLFLHYHILLILNPQITEYWPSHYRSNWVILLLMGVAR